MPGFLVGIVIGAVAASAYLKKKGGAMPSASLGQSATGGRVDELSSAADMATPESASVNAGDGTPSGAGDMSRPVAGSSSTLGSSSLTSSVSPTTGLSENRH
jgi:hypothetical protein